MEQVYKELEKRHDEALSRGFRVMDERISSFKKIVAAALLVVTLGCVFGIYSVHQLSITTTHQFCKLNQQRFEDQLKQYTSTIKYLQSDQSKSNNLKDLNKLIRQQLPKQVYDLNNSARTQPPICKSSGYAYPKVPSAIDIARQHG